MDDPSAPADRALERLTRADSPLRDELVAHSVEYLLSLRLRDAVDLERVRALVLQALTEANVERIVERHVRPGFLRYAKAIAGSDARVESLLAPATRQRMLEIARKLRIPRARWAQGAADPALLRRLLAPVWTQVLASFATRLPIPGVSGLAGAGPLRELSGMTGLLARSVQNHAEKLVDRGRSVMGGLGVDLEKRLTDAARGFSDSAAQIFRQALRERLESDEGRALFGEISAGVVEHVLRTRFADLQQDADDLPLDEIFDVVPQVVAHAARSAYVQDIVQRELDAYLALEADRTLGAMLQELGVLSEVRAALTERGKTLATRFLESKVFADFMARLLAD